MEAQDSKLNQAPGSHKALIAVARTQACQLDCRVEAGAGTWLKSHGLA